MAQRNDAELFATASEIVDPMLFHRLGELDTLVAVARQGDALEVTVRMPGEEHRAAEELGRRLSRAFDGADVRLTLVAMSEEEMARLGQTLREHAEVDAAAPDAGGGARPNQFAARRAPTRVLAIASGKGGVGKSSVTVNLAVGLAELGHTVGLLDADIYGFSVPRMIGVPYPPIMLGRTIVPPVARDVRTISMGFFVDEDKAVAWRGPMLHKALEQFLVDVHWGTLDYLVVDLPPGTGDVALSVAQQLPGAELYVVTTPQPASQRVAQRAGALARQLRLPIRGVVENMSWFVAPDGARYELFGAGGGGALATSLQVPLLAQVPFDIAVREGADGGEPASTAAPGSETAKAFAELATRIVELGPSRVYRSELTIS